MKLSDYKILTFDVYGTLIDWETGMVNALKPLTSQITPALSRNEILEAHAYFESTTQRWTPSKKYAELLAVVYRRLAEYWKVPVDWADCVRYGESVGQWPAFEDSASSLAYLKNHFQLAVLTNTDNASFSGSNAQLGVHFDGVFTAEDIGLIISLKRLQNAVLKNMRFFMSPRACFTIMGRLISMVSPIAGYIEDTTTKDLAQP
jgi:2-haloacid dehalogenase/putative hydrolase of the HAD superfamily